MLLLPPPGIVRRCALSVYGTCLLLSSGPLPAPAATDSSGLGVDAGTLARNVVIQIERKNDYLDRTKTQLTERLRRLKMGDDVAFYGAGGGEAPVFVGANVDEAWAAHLVAAADRSAAVAAASASASASASVSSSSATTHPPMLPQPSMPSKHRVRCVAGQRICKGCSGGSSGGGGGGGSSVTGGGHGHGSSTSTSTSTSDSLRLRGAAQR